MKGIHAGHADYKYYNNTEPCVANGLHISVAIEHTCCSQGNHSKLVKKIINASQTFKDDYNWLLYTHLKLLTCHWTSATNSNNSL